ncbi:MAG: hypothetical protein PHX84_01660 [Candidatus Shapirobacteria bacterium]|nr:hypothetical protein [Candidatus Shapirobacteria bacterium]
MVGPQLKKLKQEIDHYLGIPYMINTLSEGKVVGEKFLGAKGNWQQIFSETEKTAKQEKIDLKSLTPSQLYNFQKKHHLGIDCSGLVSNLLIFYGKLINKKLKIDIRKTSADILTSNKLSQEIKNPNDIKTGDLVRQKNGHHVLFIIEKKDNIVYYVDSSRKNRKVSLGNFDLTDPSFDNQGIYRLFFFN